MTSPVSGGTPAERDVITADDPTATTCTSGGVTHDWRPFLGEQFNRAHTFWRCVWCHAVTCGDYSEHDPCWLPYHHRSAHRSRAGVVWPLGGNRPDWNLS